MSAKTRGTILVRYRKVGGTHPRSLEMFRRAHRYSALWRLGQLLGSFLFLVAVTGATGPSTGTIRGRVVDAITERPIPNASVGVQQRVVDRLPDGTVSLRSMDEVASVLASVRTNTGGYFSVEARISDAQDFFKVVVNAPGYREQIEALVPLAPGQTTELNVDLVPLRMTDADWSALNEKHERRKQRFHETPVMQQHQE